MKIYETIKKRINSVPCPLCKKKDFLVSMRKPLGADEGIFTALCQGCSYNFPVNGDAVSYLRTNPDMDYWLKEMRCPECELMGADLNFRATVTIRDNRHFVTCRNCSFEYDEYVALESME